MIWGHLPVSAKDTKLPGSASKVQLALLLYAASLPRFGELPVLISGFLTGILLLHLSATSKPGRVPSWWLIFLATVGGVLVVMRSFHTLIGYEAGIALLNLMLLLKLLELRRLRDFYVAVILGLFFLVAQFLLNQSMYLAAYSLGLVLGLISLLEKIYTGEGVWSKSLRRSAIYLIQATPFVFVLFLLFPRLSAPLWDLKIPGSTGLTGLSDSMSPGSISHLVRSRDPVMRVEFGSRHPKRDSLYWRGPVLWYFNGQRWRMRVTDSERQPPEVQGNDSIAYRMIIEPIGKRWIPALDLPVEAPRDTRITVDHQVVSNGSLDQRKQFRLRSILDFRTTHLSDRDRKLALQLPDGLLPKLKTLSGKWEADIKESEQLVQKALDYFRKEPFVYTLTPPLAIGDPTEHFLFDSRAGFCEHYASAFVLLMRAAGIPARVVTGYLGGEFNQFSDYLIVRQSDAHAWAEVWLDGKGWTRVDPTAAIAPERILESVLFDSEHPGVPVTFGSGFSSPLQSIWYRISLGLDAMNTQWHIWILGYDTDRQHRLLNWLGFGQFQGYGAAIATIAGFGCVLAILTWIILFGKKRSEDPVVELYRRFLKRLSAAGIPNRLGEGPYDYAQRVANERPEIANQVLRINRAYLNLHYSGNGNKKDLVELQTSIKNFHPKKI